jgi:hypothetical protein
MKRSEERGYARESIRSRLHSVLVRTQDPIDELVLISRRRTNACPYGSNVCVVPVQLMNGDCRSTSTHVWTGLDARYLGVSGFHHHNHLKMNLLTNKATSRARCCRASSDMDASTAPDEEHECMYFINWTLASPANANRRMSHHHSICTNDDVR